MAGWKQPAWVVVRRRREITQFILSEKISVQATATMQSVPSVHNDSPNAHIVNMEKELTEVKGQLQAVTERLSKVINSLKASGVAL